MKALIIGSGALPVPNRTPVDKDMIVTPEYLTKLTQKAESAKYIDERHVALFLPGRQIIDCEIAWEGSTGVDLMRIAKKRVQVDKYGIARADLNMLYALKMSHRYKRNSVHFNKTREDILYMRRLGAEIDEGLTDWFKVREKETYDYGHPSLNQSKSEFFADDGINYEWDHDDLHKILSWNHLGAPAYTYYMKDGEEVKSDKAKFFAAKEVVRLLVVYEESIVLAFERSLWPNNVRDKQGWRDMFEFALQKVCTSITSGWFREYAWEHYGTVVSMYNERDISDLFESAYQGIIKKHGG